MRIIPVLDLKGGVAVHAVAGDRQGYRPLRSVFAPETADPMILARELRDQGGATEVYLADLDAITGRAKPAYATYQAIADLGLTIWLDAGVRDAADVGRLRDLGASRIIAGLETLAGPDALARIVATLGPSTVALSLDLRDGVPIVAPASTWLGDPRDEANLVDQGTRAGIRAIIRLDLAHVGTGRGVASVPDVTGQDPRIDWITGGGVAGAADLATLARLGYTAALVGSAWHDGRIGEQFAGSHG